MNRAWFLVALLVATGSAGCFNKDPVQVAAVDDEEVVEKATFERAAELAAAKPSRFSFAGANALPLVSAYFNGSVSSEANTGIEGAQDRSGISYNTIIQAQDFTQMFPAGQPTLVEIQLWYDNGPGRSADIDIFVDVPGMRTHVDRSYSDEVTWTLPVKTKMVSSIGQAGAVHDIGIQIANGRVAPGESIDYWMRLTFHYASDAAAPQVPYLLEVPAGVSGLIIESLKFQGDTHIDAKFVVIDPQDDIVISAHFNDLDIPTQSMYVPLKGAGSYIFYISSLRGGFLSIRADAPLDVVEARALPVVRTVVPLFDAPAAPGVGQTWVDDTSTPYTEGARVDFTVGDTFPLEVRPAVEGAVAGDVEVRLYSSEGLVSLLHRTATVRDERGSIGVTDENNDFNRPFYPENLRRSGWYASAVINGHAGSIGAEVISYNR